MMHRPHMTVPLSRYGELVGRGSAGLILFAIVGLAVAALVFDLL